MKTKLVVSLAAAVALMTLAPTGAGAVGPGKRCEGFPGMQCDAGCSVIRNPELRRDRHSGVCVRVPQICSRISGRSAVATQDLRQRLRRQRAMVSKPTMESASSGSNLTLGASFDGRDDFLWVLGPGKGFRVCIGVVEEAGMHLEFRKDRKRRA